MYTHLFILRLIFIVGNSSYHLFRAYCARDFIDFFSFSIQNNSIN